jgi:hypothetical protein
MLRCEYCNALFNSKTKYCNAPYPAPNLLKYNPHIPPSPLFFIFYRITNLPCDLKAGEPMVSKGVPNRKSPKPPFLAFKINFSV